MATFLKLVSLLLISARVTVQENIQTDACSVGNDKSFLNNDHLLNLHSESRTIVGTHEGGEVYEYYIGVCVEPLKIVGVADGCTVVQLNKTNVESMKKPKCLGVKTAAQVTGTYSLGWVELLYGGGEGYNTHCQQKERHTRIFFFCDQYAGSGDPEFIEENRDDDYCYYLFNWPTVHLCPYSIEPGWVIIIILVCLSVIWVVVMVVGVLVKRFVLGAKGLEQIPFIFYYKEMGELQADGCDLVCRCNKGHREIPMTTIGKQTTVPSGLAETESETDDDNKDDDLIPM